MDRLPSINDLERRAFRRIPRFAWEYLVSGTGDETAVHRNREALRAVKLRPRLLQGPLAVNTATTLFGTDYSAPIGIAPIGLTGLMWPGTDLALALCAARHRIPVTLSTVATTTPERIGPLTQGMAWFQLYPPRDLAMRNDLIKRARNAGFSTLVVTADVPHPSRRERQRKAKITVPTRIAPRLILQAVRHPRWTFALLRHGLPRLRTVEPYIKGRRSFAGVAGFVGATLGGTLSWEYLSQVRELWDGPVVVKGVLDPDDAGRCVDVGVDGIWLSNHGGRQLEAAESPLDVIAEIVERVDGCAKIIMDSGIRSGTDVARALALGADFVFCGRAFMFGLAGLGDGGAEHALAILSDGLRNVMHQTGCVTPGELRQRVVLT